MSELSEQVPTKYNAWFCQSCGRMTDNASRLCNVCEKRKAMAPKGPMKYPAPKDDTFQGT